jgi:hypothetical protein
VNYWCHRGGPGGCRWLTGGGAWGGEEDDTGSARG